MLAIGDKVQFEQAAMNALVGSDILTLTVQGMTLTAQKASGSVPELIEVVASSGIELKVLSIEDGEWTMEVIKEAA